MLLAPYSAFTPYAERTAGIARLDIRSEPLSPGRMPRRRLLLDMCRNTPTTSGAGGVFLCFMEAIRSKCLPLQAAFRARRHAFRPRFGQHFAHPIKGGRARRGGSVRSVRLSPLAMLRGALIVSRREADLAGPVTPNTTFAGSGFKADTYVCLATTNCDDELLKRPP